MRKLLAVAAGSGASKNEMETAARLAQELMQEYKLTELDVGQESSDGSEIVDLPAGKEGFMATWRFALVTAVARAFFCEALGLRANRARRVRIIGRRDDAEVVLEVTAFLVKEIERLASEFGQRSRDDDDLVIERLLEQSTINEQRKAYRAGLAFGVASTLEEQARRWREASEKALALYRRGKEEIANYRENKFGASHNFNAMDGSERLSAFDHGYARGREIEISRKTTKPIKGPES